MTHTAVSKIQAGTLEIAARPPGTSVNLRPREGDR